jgi:hypothetical protein
MKVTVMGSTYVLLQGDEGDDLKDIIMNTKEWFEQLFEEIVLWRPREN